MLFSGFSLDVIEESYNQDPHLSIYLKIYPLTCVCENIVTGYSINVTRYNMALIINVFIALGAGSIAISGQQRPLVITTLIFLLSMNTNSVMIEPVNALSAIFIGSIL
jgi:hypothetical protein